ncbi:DUF2905 domain-containing protein [Paenibacillus humicola]|uniref:DUF2905 domain-containing protein n=1 Tax=Paenibacillus humicola TaxID=3110540 RepID=UPI00237BB858|nr:DUF2905 domain-containing protein [Paenibacillus humicola]
MNNMPKFLIGAGILLVLIGLLWALLGKFIPLGRLPGDISIRKGNFGFYFPIVTCIVVSVVLSLVSYIVRWFMK